MKKGKKGKKACRPARKYSIPVFHGAEKKKKRKKTKEKPATNFPCSILLDTDSRCHGIVEAFVIINSGGGAYFTMKGGCRGARQPSTCGPEIASANSIHPTTPSSAFIHSSPLHAGLNTRVEISKFSKRIVTRSFFSSIQIKTKLQTKFYKRSRVISERRNIWTKELRKFFIWGRERERGSEILIE